MTKTRFAWALGVWVAAAAGRADAQFVVPTGQEDRPYDEMGTRDARTTGGRLRKQAEAASGPKEAGEDDRRTLEQKISGEGRGAEGTPSLYGTDRDSGEKDESGESTIRSTEVPEMHVVKKGDTLWDLCVKYWTDPWRWPQLWSENPLITNPHWIFPGDVLRLAAPSETGPALPQAGTPGSKIKRTGGQIGGDELIIKEFAFVDPREIAEAGRINGSREEKIMLASGDSVYVAFPGDRPLRAGERYTIYLAEKDHPIHDRTGRLVGYLVKILGDVVVDQITEGHIARGQLVDATDPIERGMVVGALFRQTRTVLPKTSTVSIEADIVGTLLPPLKRLRGLEAGYLIGSQMFVVLNKGQTSGVEAGNRFFIIRRGDGYKGVLESWEAKDPRFPKEVVAELIAVDVRENLTIAWVSRSTKELRVGDVGEMRRGY